jgi:phosphatidate cytidylyltransferase
MNLPKSNLALRWITALVILPVVLALIWVPGLRPGLAALVILIVLLVLHEFYGLLRILHLRVQVRLGLAGGLGIGLAAYFGDADHLNAALIAAIALVGFGQVLTPPPSASALAGSVTGLVYAAWCPAHVLLVDALDTGQGLVMMLLITVVFTDTAAYFAGRAFGRLPLAPIVSPKKTWEGAIGGFLFAVIGMAVLAFLRGNFGWTAFPDWSPARYAITGAAVSVVAQLSDLMKSLVKRDAGVKDSGRLLPGHGGALDRFDGFLLGAPVLYYMAVF